MEPHSGGIELKHVGSDGRKSQCAKERRPSCKLACMTVFFSLCIGRSPFSEMEPHSGGIELKHVGSDGRKSQCAKESFLQSPGIYDKVDPSSNGWHIAILCRQMIW